MQNKPKPLILSDEQRRQQRLRQLRSWAILLGVVALIAVITIIVINLTASGTTISAKSLPCYTDQSVTVFQDGVLYYDGASIHFVNASGSHKWSYPIGGGASFSVSDTHLIAWAGSQVAIVDSNGKSPYNRSMDQNVIFARIGTNHAAIVTGDMLSSTIFVKDLQGQHVHSESAEFNGRVMLDCGFFGDRGEYLWTLSFDYYSPVLTSNLHTFQVGRNKKFTGFATISDHLPSQLIYANKQLNLFTTQQMLVYDYRAVPATDNTTLVYGWKYLDHHETARNGARILLAPRKETDQSQAITELRVIAGSLDRRYTLPSACVGAAINDDHIFAFSQDYLYSGKVDSQRFYAHAIPLPDGRKVTELVGLTNNGHAIVASGSEIYSITLPR